MNVDKNNVYAASMSRNDISTANPGMTFTQKSTLNVCSSVA